MSVNIAFWTARVTSLGEVVSALGTASLHGEPRINHLDIET